MSGEPKTAHVTPAFQPGKNIQLKSQLTGKYLQRSADGSVDAMGEAGSENATFVVHRAGKTGLKVSLQCCGDKTKFLRVHGATIDGLGNGGPACQFRVVKHAEDHTISLQAKENKGGDASGEDKYFLGVNAEGRPTQPSETGPGAASRFHIEIVTAAKVHAPAAVGLSDGVNFRLQNKASGKFMRLLPGGLVDAAGDAVDNTTVFTVHAVGKGLAKVTLQSVADPAHFLRLKDNVLDCLGSHDPWSIFRVVTNDDGSVAFHAKTKKKDDESKFFVGFDKDGNVSAPELTTSDEYGSFYVSVVGHRAAAHK